MAPVFLRRKGKKWVGFGFFFFPPTSRSRMFVQYVELGTQAGRTVVINSPFPSLPAAQLLGGGDGLLSSFRKIHSWLEVKRGNSLDGRTVRQETPLPSPSPLLDWIEILVLEERGGEGLRLALHVCCFARLLRFFPLFPPPVRYVGIRRALPPPPSLLVPFQVSSPREGGMHGASLPRTFPGCSSARQHSFRHAPLSAADANSSYARTYLSHTSPCTTSRSR